MSATKRGGQWLNKGDDPYTKQYEKLQPTLKQLLYEKQLKIDKLRTKKKQNEKENTVLRYENFGIESDYLFRDAAFNIKAKREFDYAAETLGPGPGSYIDINDPKYSSVLHKSAPYGEIEDVKLRKVNVPNQFGSTIDRFDNPAYK